MERASGRASLPLAHPTVGPMRLVEVEDALKWQGTSFKLGPLRFTLSSGEILAVIGPRMAGKTTLLRLLWGFIRPDSGSARVLGLTPHLDQIRVRTRTGFVGDSARCYGWMSAAQYTRFIGAFYPNFDWLRAYRLLRHLDLNPSTRIGTMSRDRRVKLALVSAMAHSPDLLILDEPIADLNRSVSAEILCLLQDLANSGVGIVVSSRQIRPFDRLADSVLVLNRGGVERYKPASLRGHRDA